MSDNRWKERHRTDTVPKAMRAELLWLISRKLKGERRNEAVKFARSPFRTQPDIQTMIARLAPLDDLERDCSPNAIVTDAAVREMVQRRAAGATLQELSDAYGISTAQIWRICTGKARTAATGLEELA
jgi:hypothetical protein